MKIGGKQIALFAVAAILLFAAYQYDAFSALWKGNSTAVPTQTPDEKEDVQDAIAGTSFPFDSNRLERDRARARTKELYQTITTDPNAKESTVTDAYRNIILLTQQAEQESKVETLIREKGFADAYACFSDLGEMDVLIKAEQLTETQVTQVADIIVRYTGLDYSAIHVRKVA